MAPYPPPVCALLGPNSVGDRSVQSESKADRLVADARVYFGKEGEQMVILLGGGTKQRQQNDIKLALERWEDYKQRKKQQKEKGGE
jgi:hypothetical protein